MKIKKHFTGNPKRNFGYAHNSVWAYSFVATKK
jgi:hypothetical protein